MRDIRFAVFVTGILLLIGIFVVYWFFVRGVGSGEYTTKFEYTDNVLDTLPNNSSVATTFDDLVRMDQEIFRAVSWYEMSETEAVRLYTSIALIQHDFLSLSYGKTGGYAGSVVPITKKILCVKIARACGDVRLLLADVDAFTDSYTIALTDTVYSAFLMSEKEHGINATLSNVPDVEITEVDEETRSTEVSYIQELIAGRTEDKLRAAIFWDGTTGSKRSSGIWLSILDENLAKLMKTFTFGEVLSIRTDVLIAAHDAYMQALKEGESTPRTSLQSLVPSLVPVLPPEVDDIVPIPDVAFITAMSSMLMPYLQGEALEYYIEERDKAVASRLWSGAYLPSDIATSERIGEQVAEFIKKD